MNYLVVLIVNDIDDMPAILTAWEEAGVTGITILESTGLGRLRRTGLRDDLPLFPSIHDLYQFGEVHHRTLFSVVDSQEMVDKLVALSEKIAGNFDDPHTGFLFVVPVSQTYGLGTHRTDRSNE
jgi:nitrogen regulatory protein PII